MKEKRKDGVIVKSGISYVVFQGPAGTSGI